MFTDRSRSTKHEVNTKGETPLHFASKNNNPSRIASLLAEGADVNAKNKWHQTPLHYAAIAESVQSIETLSQSPCIDVNIRDVNGYNALQCIIATKESNGYDYNQALLAYLDELEASDNPDDIIVPEDRSKMVSDSLKKTIKILVDAGTDLNNQTVFGYSILHLAARRKDCTALLKHFIENFPHIKLNLEDKMGQHFLYEYDNMESVEKTFDFFSWISKLDNSKLTALLSSRNALGKALWTLMIPTGLNLENLKKILGYGVSGESADNLGSTVLHRACGITEGTCYDGVLEYLLENCNDINTTNIYGEPAVSMALYEENVELFLKFKVNLNIRNRWGGSPLVSLMKGRPSPDFLKTLIEKGKIDINTRDEYGSTPLHIAAYQNYMEQVELLLKYGADKHALDRLEERPIDTAKRHRGFQCLPLLKTTDISYKEFESFLKDIPQTITSSSIQTKQDVQRLLGVPTDTNLVMKNLLESYYTKNPQYFSEVEDIVYEVNNLVKMLCKQIEKYDSRFVVSVFPSGSMAEGTKIGRPNEFDFILCLNRLNDITYIVTENLLKTGFACLKFKTGQLDEQFLSFTDAHGYFLPRLFLQYFFNYLQRALHEPHLWERGNIYFNSENKLRIAAYKPVFTFDVYWFGSVHKQLKISIDIVPAIYKKGWWPPNIDEEKIPLINDDIKAAGCLLTLQAKTFKFVRLDVDDFVSHTCNTETSEEESVKNRMLRISAAPAEICLMKMLPNNFRYAYVLAKVLKDICPEIDVETKQYHLEEFDLEYAKPRRTKPSELIKSYMLKNGIFYVLEELKMQNHSVEGLEVSQITAKLYRFLLNFIKDLTIGRYIHMRPYFLSEDLNVFKDPREHSYNKRFVYQLQCEFSIKLLLGMLNEQFPKDCFATNMLYKLVHN